jgi:hypothetical protein
MPKYLRCKICGEEKQREQMNHEYRVCFYCISIIPKYIQGFRQKQLYLRMKIAKHENKIPNV